MALQVSLMQGATTIATRLVTTLSGSFSDFNFELSALERSRITDLANLQLVLQAGVEGEAVAYARVELNAPKQVSLEPSGHVQSAFLAFF